MTEGQNKEQNLVLISILYQMLDNDEDISNMNPFVQDYLSGLIEEIETMEEDEQEMIYFYADTFFNKLNNNKEGLN
jgi:ubiquitin C-terminal hydrolase